MQHSQELTSILRIFYAKEEGALKLLPAALDLVKVVALAVEGYAHNIVAVQRFESIVCSPWECGQK